LLTMYNRLYLINTLLVYDILVYDIYKFDYYMFDVRSKFYSIEKHCTIPEKAIVL